MSGAGTAASADIAYRATSQMADAGALIALLTKGLAMIERQRLDRYGRTLALITVNGKNAGQYFMNLWLARPWLKHLPEGWR